MEKLQKRGECGKLIVKDVKQARDAAQEDYLKTKTIFHYQNKNISQNESGLDNLGPFFSSFFFIGK